MKKILIVLVTSFLFVSCASNVSQSVNQPIVKSFSAANTIYLVVSHSANVAEDKDLESVKKDLILEITKKAKLKTPNVQVITKAKPASGLVANIEIQELSYVSGAARFMAGALSGKAKLGVKFDVVDLSSNQKITESILGTSSKFSEGIFGGTTGRQVEAISEQITSQFKELATN